MYTMPPAEPGKSRKGSPTSAPESQRALPPHNWQEKSPRYASGQINLSTRWRPHPKLGSACRRAVAAKSLHGLVDIGSQWQSPLVACAGKCSHCPYSGVCARRYCRITFLRGVGLLLPLVNTQGAILL